MGVSKDSGVRISGTVRGKSTRFFMFEGPGLYGSIESSGFPTWFRSTMELGLSPIIGSVIRISWDGL